jgi:ABC-2 type transport system ATP-binding protein
MITIEHLTVRYGSLVAVNDLSLHVPAGEVLGLVGPNGAGKTTTMKVLCGLLPLDSGHVAVDGCSVEDSDGLRKRIGYMADFFGVYDYLTVYEYLAFFGGMNGLEGSVLDDRIHWVLGVVNLAIKEHAFVRTLSRGMKQRLYFARAVVHDPPLLVLDEPASGLDPRGRAELIETLKRLHGAGKTILISSHILSELQGLVTSVGIMEAGRLVDARSVTDAGTAIRRRTVALHVATHDSERAVQCLAGREGVHAVRAATGAILVETDDNDQAVAALVRFLIEQRVAVLLPKVEGADLKDIFLRMTKGELM